MNTVNRSFAGATRKRAALRPPLARHVLAAAVVFAIATSASAGATGGQPNMGIGPMPTPGPRLLAATVNAGRMHGEPVTGVIGGQPNTGFGPLPTPAPHVLPVTGT